MEYITSKKKWNNIKMSEKMVTKIKLWSKLYPQLLTHITYANVVAAAFFKNDDATT